MSSASAEGYLRKEHKLDRWLSVVKWPMTGSFYNHLCDFCHKEVRTSSYYCIANPGTAWHKQLHINCYFKYYTGLIKLSRSDEYKIRKEKRMNILKKWIENHKEELVLDEL